MPRAQEQRVVSLEGQSTVSSFPHTHPILHPHTPHFPSLVSGSPYLTGHEQQAHHS